MFQDGTMKRLAGVIREIASEMNHSDEAKANMILESMKAIGSFGDLRHLDMLLGAIIERTEQEIDQGNERILYSSSLRDGDYYIMQAASNGEESPVTCKCVYCNDAIPDITLTAAIKSESITVYARCVSCGKKTEVYYLGIGKLPESATEENESPTVDFEGVGGEG